MEQQEQAIVQQPDERIDRVQRILQRYEKARSAKTKVTEKMIELDKFDRGEQWEGKYPPWVPKPVTNYIHLVKTTQRANLALQNQVAMLRPLHPEDDQAVQSLQKAYDGVWYRTDARYYVRDTIETALLLSTGILMVYWDDKIVSTRTGDTYLGDIRLKEIDPANFFPDPNAYRLKDCSYVVISEIVSLDWVKNNPTFINYAGRAALAELRPNMEKVSDTEIYHRSYRPDVSTGDMIVFIQYWEKEMKDDGTYQFNVTYVAGDLELYRIEGVRPNMYPFAILYDYPQRKSFWGKSTCELILENQKIINKVEQVTAIIATLMQNPQKEVLKESGINPKEVAIKGNKPGMVWTSNMPDGIRYLDPPQMPKYLLEFAEYAKQNIRDQTGLSEAYLGESVGSLTTSTGVNSLIERATVRDRDKMIEIERFIKDLTEIIISFMLEFYKEERYIRIIQEDGSYEFFKFNASDYQGLRYDIHVDVTGKTPTSKALLADQGRDLLNMQGQYQFDPPIIIPEEALDMLDIRDKEKIKARMREQREQNQLNDTIQVAGMLANAMLQGASPEQMYDMAQQMLEELENQRRVGATGNTAPLPSQQNTGLAAHVADNLSLNNMRAGR